MSFEVPIRPLRRSRRPILLPPLIALAVVAVGVIGGPPARPAPRPGSPAPSASAAEISAALTDCNELPSYPCRDIVRAAQLALEPSSSPISSATAWRSLICGDDHDCPRGILDGARPAGSVVFTFVDGGGARVNVVWRDVSSRRFEDGSERLDAYVVRAFGPPT